MHNGDAVRDAGDDTFAQTWEQHRAALVIAHPGHELRIHSWLERARPVTFVLTDGSGRAGRSRIGSTTALLERAGARAGATYAPLSDRQLYEAVLSGERKLFLGLADDLAAALWREGVAYVVGDAAEGFNPAHDICRLLLNAALLRVGQAKSRRLRNMEFPVEAPPDACPAEDRAAAIILTLDETAYRRKIEAARANPEMAAEVERGISTHGAAAFRIECIRPVGYGLEIGHRFAHPCFYEQYGEKQVAAGFYRDVIRYREHIEPLAAYLASACHSRS